MIRKSRHDEYGHQRYYDHLGYIYVYSGHVDDSVEDPELYAGWRALHARLAVLPEPGRPALPAPAPGAA